MGGDEILCVKNLVEWKKSCTFAAGLEISTSMENRVDRSKLPVINERVFRRCPYFRTDKFNFYKDRRLKERSATRRRASLKSLKTSVSKSGARSIALMD